MQQQDDSPYYSSQPPVQEGSKLLTETEPLDSNLAIFILNPEDVITQIKYQLLCFDYDIEKEKWFKPKDTDSRKWKPLIPEDYLGEFIVIIRSAVNRVVMLSYFEDMEQLNVFGREFFMNVGCLTAKLCEMGKINFEDMDVILMTIITPVYTALLGAYQGGMRKALREQLKMIQTIRDDTKQDKKGLFGRLFR